MDLPALPLPLYQPGPGQDGKVLGHRLPGERQPGREHGLGRLAIGQDQVKHLAAGRVGDRLP